MSTLSSLWNHYGEVKETQLSYSRFEEDPQTYILQFFNLNSHIISFSNGICFSFQITYKPIFHYVASVTLKPQSSYDI